MSKVGLIEKVRPTEWNLYEIGEKDENIMRVLLDYARHPWYHDFGLDDA
ncbi:MAG: hypothetical protein ACFFAS_09995 [Promethearchaeota archaeon]